MKKRLGKSLAPSFRDKRTDTLLSLLGKMVASAPSSTKRQWYSIVKSCGLGRSELIEKHHWVIASSTWSRVTGSQVVSSFPNVPASSSPSVQPSPNPNSLPQPLSALIIPQQQQTNNNTNKRCKEVSNTTLLPFLEKFFQSLAIPSPCSPKASMPHSVNRLHKIYRTREDKPCSISLSCFRRIWRVHFKKNYRKAKHRDGLCQLCEIGHKLDQISAEHLTEQQKSALSTKKAIVSRHHFANKQNKSVFQEQLEQCRQGPGMAVLTMDFKQNITIGGGPRELGQSWYARERRTIFGLCLYICNGGELSKWHFNIVSNCLTHDAIFVKMALSKLFATEIWKSFRISHLAIWSDNAAHFKNKALLWYYANLCTEKEFKTISLGFFEAYHGKSEVDGMFGVMTQWIQNWVKSRFINTTQDLLDCFAENNQFHPNGARNFFFSWDFPRTFWKNLAHLQLSNLKIKSFNFFQFNSQYQEYFKTFTFQFRFNKTTNSWEKLQNKSQTITLKEVMKTAKEPKYSESIEAVNAAHLTSSDEQFLLKKADQWKLPYEE